MVARGLALLWDQKGGQGFQSAIDLTEPFRCKDPWWNATLDEFRYLVPTKDTHAFLHGTETTVPGSWFENRAACDSDECKELPSKWHSMKNDTRETKQGMECATCSEERRTRCRITPQRNRADACDQALPQPPCAVPTNDLRYELNKLRSRLFARNSKVQLLWSPAKDRVGLEALRSDPSLPGKKKQWLQRHDRQCGDCI